MLSNFNLQSNVDYKTKYYKYKKKYLNLKKLTGGDPDRIISVTTNNEETIQLAVKSTDSVYNTIAIGFDVDPTQITVSLAEYVIDREATYEEGGIEDGARLTVEKTLLKFDAEELYIPDDEDISGMRLEMVDPDTEEEYDVQLYNKIIKTDISPKQMKEEAMKDLDNILRLPSHPHVVPVESIYYNDDLYEKFAIYTKSYDTDLYLIESITEDDFKILLKGIIEGIIHLHKNNIFHGKIDPGNIVMKEEDPTYCLLRNYGTSAFLYDRDIARRGCCGRLNDDPIFFPPEHIDGRYGYEGYIKTCKEGNSYQSDVWSIGIVTLFILQQRFPFMTSDRTSFNRMQNQDFGSGPDGVLPDAISPLARDFIRSCTKVNPEERPCIYEIINDPWLS